MGFWFHSVCVPPSAFSCICSLTQKVVSLCSSSTTLLPLPWCCMFFDVLGMVFLCCFGPASVFGRLCISGLQGFTAPSLPSYGILCFVSVEGLVRIRASSPAWKISNSIVSRSYLGLGIFSDPCLELRGIFPLSSKPSSVFIHALGVMVCCQCSRCLKVLKGVSGQEVGFHLSVSGV